MKLEGYSIQAFWGPRRESPASIARRFLTLVDSLTPIDPAFGNWICAVDDEPVKLDLIRNAMAQFVESHVTRADDGDPTPISGYHFFAVNTYNHTPRSFGIYINAGSWASSIYTPGYINYADIGTSDFATPDPAILTFHIFRGALLALVDAFDVTFCNAYPDTILKLWKDRHFRPGWINYVSARFAPLVTPPKSAIVEYQPNGGLLMSATDETFVTSNPQHLAVARDIEAALAPLNALPWPPDAEPEQETTHS